MTTSPSTTQSQQSVESSSNTKAPRDDLIVTKHRGLLSTWLHGKQKKKADESLVFRTADVIFEGYLMKQGLRLKRWSKRYFILRLERDHMTLSYYTSKDDLTLCTSAAIGPGHRILFALDGTANSHPLRFVLQSDAYTLTLEALTRNDFSQWTVALREAVRWNDAMVSQAPDGTKISFGKQKLSEAEHAKTNHASSTGIPAEKKVVAVTAPSSGRSTRPTFLDATRPGHQCFMANTTKFDIPSHYQFLKVVGSGAYGVVISVNNTSEVALSLDTDNQEKGDTSETSVRATPSTSLAIKNIQRAFDDLTDAKRIVREIKLMRHLTHKNLLGVLDLLPPVSLATFEDVYIVSELMATDLHKVIYSRHALSNEHVAFFMYQLLCGIQFLHSANVIHRDLKPSNVLLNANCELKICDFGLARGVSSSEDDETTENLTEYVVTRWYRAPEIMLGCAHYTKSIDVWSLGCIFAEMLTRKPLFPGQDYIDQLHLIMNTLGAPTEEELSFLTNSRALKFMVKEATKRAGEISKPLASFFEKKKYGEPPMEPLALDLMTQMLQMDPNCRISVAAALEHPYLSKIRTLADETLAPEVFNFDFETDTAMEKPNLQRLIWDEMLTFHPECRDVERDGESPPPSSTQKDRVNYVPVVTSTTPPDPVHEETLPVAVAVVLGDVAVTVTPEQTSTGVSVASEPEQTSTGVSVASEPAPPASHHVVEHAIDTQPSGMSSSSTLVPNFPHHPDPTVVAATIP